eukprot:jgi/Mesvir1/13956/Mv22896-RA.1
MPPNLEQANGRLFFKAIQTRELTGISQDSTQNASLKIVQENGNTALQAVNPDGSLGAKLVIGATSAYLESTTSEGGGATTSKVGITSAGVVGGASQSLPGLNSAPTYVTSTYFMGLVADNDASSYRTSAINLPQHTVLSSTTNDLVLTGNRTISGKYNPAPKCHVITLGELHAYQDDGTSSEGGDAVKVMGRRMGPFSTSYEPASINLGIHHNVGFALTGLSTTRGRVSTTPETDLSLESGSQLRMIGNEVVIHSHAAVKIFPNKSTFTTPADDVNNPHGYLQISHKNNDQAEAVILSTPGSASSMLDIVVKPATGKFGAEADTFELGSGDVRYKFTVVGGQLQIKKRVLSTGLPDKTICVFDA